MNFAVTMKAPQRLSSRFVRRAMMMSRSLLIALLAASSFAFLPGPARAQERAQDDDPPPRGWTITLGPGVRFAPKYPGADDLGLGPMPIFDLRRRGAPLTFEAPDESIGMGLIGGDDEGFEIGPAVNLQGKRQEEDVGAAVGDVPFTIEAGAFAQVFVADNLRLRVEGRRGVGGHDGWLGDLSADFVVRDRDTYVFSIGPRLRWADNRYHDAYFGVTAPVALATGLPAYNPGSGIYAYGAAAGLSVMLNDHWGLYAMAGYDRLVGDAGDSPIVAGFGSRDQFTAGIGISYSFNVARLFGR